MSKAKKFISGNKGEWSEIYVILELLATGKLYSADKDMNRIDNVFYQILKIIREESNNSKFEYVVNGSIKIIDGNTKQELLIVETEKFINAANDFFKLMKERGGNSFAMPEFEDFLNEIYITSKKSKSENKADITIMIHDAKTNNPTLSFSIKSLVGQDSTLLNPGPGTNFIYKISHPQGKTINTREFNLATYSGNGRESKIGRRIKELESIGFEVTFEKIQSETFQLNVELIDSSLPRILSYMLLYKYKYGLKTTKELLDNLKKENPLGFNLSLQHPFYEYKISGLLYDYALGMTAEKVWHGIYSATGGIIIVKDSGEVVCYHVYDKNIFQKYLIDNTFFEQASTGEDESMPGHPRTDKKSKKYFYGWVYEEGGQYFIKLNLQIRFL